MTDDAPGGPPTSKIDSSRPHTARVWNYWLGGKDYYPVDQVASEQIRRMYPGTVDYARADREFLRRAVQYLAGEVGVRQFLDIGAGLPTMDNTHEIAQRVAPDSRVVYADNDPLVLVHSRALLASGPKGATAYLDADLRDTDTILSRAAETLDFSQPVALLLLGVVIFIEDDEEAYAVVRRLLDALPAGSHLVLSHTVVDSAMPDVDAIVAFWNEHGTPRLTQRPASGIARFFDGLDLLEPGVVSCSRWRPPANLWSEPAEVAMFGGVGRKPR